MTKECCQCVTRVILFLQERDLQIGSVIYSEMIYSLTFTHLKLVRQSSKVTC